MCSPISFSLSLAQLNEMYIEERKRVVYIHNQMQVSIIKRIARCAKADPFEFTCLKMIFFLHSHIFSWMKSRFRWERNANCEYAFNGLFSPLSILIEYLFINLIFKNNYRVDAIERNHLASTFTRHSISKINCWSMAGII